VVFILDYLLEACFEGCCSLDLHQVDDFMD